MAEKSISKTSSNDFTLPAAKTTTAPWRVKGDGVVYTTSQEIIESLAWQRSFNAARKIKLKPPSKR